jgi:hypothetical protein
MAKYIAYKESGNLINDAVAKCINEGTRTGVTAPATTYTTPTVTNTASITFEGAYLGILNATNNVSKTGTIVLGVSSVGSGIQTYQYPLSTLTDAISSDKVDRTVINTSIGRSFYFKFPSTISVNTNYCLYYRVSTTGTSIDAKYYGLIGNPSNNLLTTQSTIADDLLVIPHITVDGNINPTTINVSSNANISFLNYIIERNSSLLAHTSPYTITVKSFGDIILIDGAVLSLKSQLTSKGILCLENYCSINLNGGNILTDGQQINNYANFLNSNVPTASAAFKISNSNDILNWSLNDSLLILPQKDSSIFQNTAKIKSINNDTIQTVSNISPYLSSKKIIFPNDIINVSSGVILSSINVWPPPVATTMPKYYIKYFNINGVSNINLNNTTIENFGIKVLQDTKDIFWGMSSGYEYTKNIKKPFPYGRSGQYQCGPTYSTVQMVVKGSWDGADDKYGFYGLRTTSMRDGIHSVSMGVNAAGRVGLAYYRSDVHNVPSSAGKVSIISSTFLQNNTWYDIRLISNGLNLQIYVNGNIIIDHYLNQNRLFYPGYNATNIDVILGFGFYSTSHIRQYDGVFLNNTHLGSQYPDEYARLFLDRHSPLYEKQFDYKDIFTINSLSKPNISISNSKIISINTAYSNLFTNNKNISSFIFKDSISYNNKIEFSETNTNTISSIEFNNNLLLNSPLQISTIKNGSLLNFDNNTYILPIEYPALNLLNTDIKDSTIKNQIIISPLATGITYSPINKTSNTLTLSNIKIYNDVPTSNSKGLIISKGTAKYTDPVNVTMTDCDITGSVELNVCNGLIDLKNSIIKQKNTAEPTLTLTLSNQNSLVNVDNLTCFRNTLANNHGLYIKNEITEFSKPSKIVVKNSKIYGGISYDGNSGMVKNILYNLPVDKDTYSINIINSDIINFDAATAGIYLISLWPTQVVNISSVNATRTTATDKVALHCATRGTNATAGKTTYPYNVNIKNCNLEGSISLNYNNALEDIVDSKSNPFNQNEVCATSLQNILSTNIRKTNYGIKITDAFNPRIYTIIDSLSFTPIDLASTSIGSVMGTTKNALKPFKVDIRNSILTGGQFSLDNFYGDITNNIISLSSFDDTTTARLTFGDGPVSIKNNRVLVSNLSTGDFIKPDSSCNYSYNINSNYNYCKVELKSVSSFRVDIPNPNTDSIYQESNWVGSRFGLTLASQATAFNYQTRSVSSGSIILSSAAAASTAFATFSLNSKVNFLRFKATSPINIYAKMFLNEKMVYCGNLISYPFFIINMREFEWDKKDTFHFVMYFTDANTSVTLSDFTFSDNGAEFIPFSISDIGFYNRISHDLITKFKTIHPRKNNKGNYINLFVDETIESPSYDASTTLGVANQPLNQNVIKTGANISLGKIDSKYITGGTTLANIFDATKQQYQYFYNGDMTLYNDDKLISADYDGNLVDTGAPSERVVPRAYLNGKFDHPHRTKSSPKYVALNAGDYAKVFVFVAKTSFYSLNPINAPRLVVAKNVALGIKEDTILDQFTDDMMIDKNYTDWVLLQGSTPAVTNDGVLEFYVDCCGDNVNGTGYINVDSWSASTDNNIGEYWFSDEGETDWHTV